MLPSHSLIVIAIPTPASTSLWGGRAIAKRRAKMRPVSSSGAIDWPAVERQAASFEWLSKVIPRGDVQRHRLGNCSIVVEWLVQATPGALEMASHVEADLAAVAAADLPGFPRLLRRMASADRVGFFALLSEVMVAAWYLRSDRRVLDLHADNGQGDVVVADGGNTAHVEVMELSAPVKQNLWQERWSELVTRLRLLRVPFGLDVHGPSDLRYVFNPAAGWDEPVRDPAPDLHDLDWIVGQVETRLGWNRPWRLAPGFSQKYPDLWIEATDEFSGVTVSWSSNGWAFPASSLVDRILKKRPPACPGRKVLVVEVSRYPGETLVEEWSRRQVKVGIARRVKSWDAIIAFTRWWKRPGVADVYVLHLAPQASDILPEWPGVPWAGQIASPDQVAG